MIFFVAMPFVIGLMNFVVPLQLGVRERSPFPVLNSDQLLADLLGRAAVNMSLIDGSFARTGWLVYPPSRSSPSRPDVGVDITCGRCRSLASHAADRHHFAPPSEAARAGPGLHAYAVFCWTALASTCDRGPSRADGDARDADLDPISASTSISNDGAKARCVINLIGCGDIPRSISSCCGLSVYSR